MPSLPPAEHPPDPGLRLINRTPDALAALGAKAREHRRLMRAQEQAALDAAASTVTSDPPAPPTPGPSRAANLPDAGVLRSVQRARMIQETDSTDVIDVEVATQPPIPAPNFGVLANRDSTTPTTPRKLPRLAQVMTPEAKAMRSAQRLLKLQEALDEPGQDSAPSLPPIPIPAPNFGTPKGSKTIPSPTERSPIPPSTKRSLSYPSMGNTKGYKFIGFDPEVQALMNRHKLSWAVQYEISRFRSQSANYWLTPAEYDHIFRELEGPNDKARHAMPLIRSCVRARRDAAVRDPEHDAHLNTVKQRIEELERPRPEHDPYLHLDKEEKAIADGLGAGLGLSTHGPEPGWFGGQVAQVAVLVEMKKKGGFTTDSKGSVEFVLVLQKHRVGRSTRVARKFGSRRLLQVSLPAALVQRSGESILKFFSHKFVLNGRVFEPIEAKDHTVYLLETSDYDESGSGLATWSYLSSNGRMSVLDFMQWHNPMADNSNQSSSKWAARFSLAFSTSQPACRFDPVDIFEIPDIMAEGISANAPPSRCIMTDGCGFMNKAVALQVQRLLDLKYLPTAVQARIAGVKGIFLLHPDRDENTIDRPRLWCRPSQIKIRRGQHFLTNEASQLTLDLLRYANPKQPAHLSKEVISCLAFGGVGADDLERIFLAALKEQYDQLATWDGPLAEIKLWAAVFELEHVLMGRLRRETAGASRVWGFGEDIGTAEAELSLDSDDEDDMSDRSVASSPDLLSGLPSSLAEQVLSYLAAGFRPETSPLLKQSLEMLIKGVISQFVEKYRVAIPGSVEGFAVPDPTGLLEEGEIYFRGTEQWQDATGMWCDILIGDVLAVRHPCKVASDVQKFRAVDRPELRGWSDVVVFSIKGSRSPMSLLGGGDYDGDTVIVIRDSVIVNAFQNAPLRADGLCQGDPADDFIEKNFDKSLLKMSEIIQSTAGDPDGLAKALQSALLAPLVHESIVGHYSVLHEKASFIFGYDDPKTIRLAHTFCACLDGLKGGISVKKEVRRADREMFDVFQLPVSRGGLKGFTESVYQSPRKKAPRQESLGADIIDRLWDAGQVARDGYIAKLRERPSQWRDKGLCQPYEDTLQRIHGLLGTDAAAMLRLDVDSIERAVQHTRGEYDTRLHGKTRPFWRLPVLERQDLLRSVSAELRAQLDMIQPRILSRSDVMRVAASYAYWWDMETYNETHPSYPNKGTAFPFDVMFRELAEINARNTGRSVTITSQFADRFVVHRSFLRVLGTGY